MTAVRAGDDVVIFDMGLNLSKVLIHDNVETERMHSLDLIDMGAIPDDRVMSDIEVAVRRHDGLHVALDLLLDQLDRERRRDDRRVVPVGELRDGADVVEVAVRRHNGLDRKSVV